MSYPATIAHAVQQAQEWLKQVRDYADLADEQHAYSVLRAVLHQLRDRLTLEEAFELAAQLPLIVRGVYFEGYRPSHAPQKNSLQADVLGWSGGKTSTPPRCARCRSARRLRHLGAPLRRG